MPGKDEMKTSFQTTISWRQAIDAIDRICLADLDYRYIAPHDIKILATAQRMAEKAIKMQKEEKT
jgi:hypothetical protein